MFLFLQITETESFYEEYCGYKLPMMMTTTSNIVRVIFWSTFGDSLELNIRSDFMARYSFLNGIKLNGPIYEKTCLLHMRNRRLRSAARFPSRAAY